VIVHYLIAFQTNTITLFDVYCFKFSFIFVLYSTFLFYSVKPKATCHVTRQSKHQCTCL